MIPNERILEIATNNNVYIYKNGDCAATKEEFIAFALAIAKEQMECDAKMVDNLYHETYMRNIRDCAAAIRNQKLEG